MLHALEVRAPAIAWFGQFFVLVGEALNSVEIGLLLFIFAAQTVTLVVLFSVYRSLAGGHALPALAGCLAVAAAPMFVAMTHQYLTEPLQCLSVAWFVGIMILGGQWRRTTLLAHLVGATAFAMLAKVSSPLYCALPGLVALWLLLRRQAPSERRFEFAKDWGPIVGLAAAVLLAAAAASWYKVNWIPLTEYVRSSSSGAVAEYYGERASFLSKLLYWVSAGVQSLSYPPVLLVLAPLIGLALLSAAAERRPIWSARVSLPCLPVAAAAAQIVVVLSVFSTQVNEDPRYLLPLAPYTGLLLTWALTRLRHALWSVLATSALLVQLGVVYAHAMGVMPPDPALPNYLLQLAPDRQDREDVEAILAATCPPGEAARLNVVGVELYWLSEQALSFYAAKQQVLGDSDSRCFYTSLGAYESDASRAWDRMLASNFDFFVTLDPTRVNVPSELEFLNQVSLPVLQRVRTDPLFTPIATNGSRRLMLFRHGMLRTASRPA
jgi:hypothetical protein